MAIDRTVAWVGGAALVTLVAASVLVLRPWVDDPFSECREASVAGGPGTLGGPFTLVDETGKTVTDKDVITRPTLLYFGYTFCPDVCPLDSARNAEAVEILTERGRDVGNVMISIDPERDTPEVMADFTSYFPGDYLGLTGTPEQVAAAAKAYRVLYQKQDGDPADYLVSHSTFTYLVLPEVGFVEFFNRDDTPEEMADRIGCFIDAS
ncbi:SCO family protein [Frigidibacter sp. ROC022]|uniref:SCO family protein n=1 Tax=Frigidibacter sp. ROC022 TaxID=2971796 RepID=UPI00215A22F8|nr:SCO family protein [Frigidibacter sp. ROC022]MCR8724495.1 SCO family protein [Frigidibacter sp. ROC022]